MRMTTYEKNVTYYLGLVARIPVFGVSDKAIFKQSTPLQRLARKLNFTCSKFTYGAFQKANNKDVDQAAGMRRLVCTCVNQPPPHPPPPPPPEDRFCHVAANYLSQMCSLATCI